MRARLPRIRRRRDADPDPAAPPEATDPEVPTTADAVADTPPADAATVAFDAPVTPGAEPTTVFQPVDATLAAPALAADASPPVEPTAAEALTGAAEPVDPDLPAAVVPSDPTAPPEPTFRDRGRYRRRLRYLRRVRELGFRDLGGLIFDLHRFGREGDALVRGKLAALEIVDRELRALEHTLDQRRDLIILREPGISACPRCAALNGSDARYCSTCGVSLVGPLAVAEVVGPIAPSPAAAAPPAGIADQPTGPLPAVPAPAVDGDGTADPGIADQPTEAIPVVDPAAISAAATGSTPVSAAAATGAEPADEAATDVTGEGPVDEPAPVGTRGADDPPSGSDD